VSDWTWEYVLDAAHVIVGLTQQQVAEVEALAARIADAVAVRRIGTPFDVQEAVSSLKTYGEGPLLIWFLEDYREDVVLVVRVQHLGFTSDLDLRVSRVE
jgi:plasmid stabilization system protein ParE